MSIPTPSLLQLGIIKFNFLFSKHFSFFEAVGGGGAWTPQKNSVCFTEAVLRNLLIYQDFFNVGFFRRDNFFKGVGARIRFCSAGHGIYSAPWAGLEKSWIYKFISTPTLQ